MCLMLKSLFGSRTICHASTDCLIFFQLCFWDQILDIYINIYYKTVSSWMGAYYYINNYRDLLEPGGTIAPLGLNLVQSLLLNLRSLGSWDAPLNIKLSYIVILKFIKLWAPAPWPPLKYWGFLSHIFLYFLAM